jgi:Tol biopolymer transport system component
MEEGESSPCLIQQRVADQTSHKPIQLPRTGVFRQTARGLASLSRSDESRIQIIKMNGGTADTVELKDWQIQSITWCPDNKNLYVSGLSATSASWGLLRVGLGGELKSLLEVPGGQGYLANPKPSPDGRYLAYVLQTYESNVAMLEHY